MPQPKLIYVGVKGSVVALDSSTGVQVWTRKLKGSQFVNVAFRAGEIFAATSGEVFCLDAQTGDVRWRNPLKGFGYGLVSMAGHNLNASQFQVLAEKQQQDEAAASANASTTGSGS
jgi:outer membrane protein assembly factor BamB